MIRPPVFLGRPNAWGLILMLAIVPAGYFIGANWLLQKASHHQFTPVPQNYRAEKFLERWLQISLDYSSGYDCSFRKQVIKILNPELQARFENDFWPQELRNCNPELFVYSNSSKTKIKNSTLVEVSNSIKILSLDNENAFTDFTVKFDVDFSSGLANIIGYKFEKSESKRQLKKLLTQEAKCSHSRVATSAVKHFKKAIRFHLLNDDENSVVELDKAISIDPNFRNAILFKVKHCQWRKPDIAVKDLSRAIEIAPKQWSLYRARSSCRLDCGDIKGAIADLNIAIEHEPEIAYAYINLAYCLSQLGNLDQALKEYDKAIKLEPNLENFYIFRGLAKDSCKDKTGTRLDYEVGKQRLKSKMFYDSDNRPLLLPYVSFAP